MKGSALRMKKTANTRFRLGVISVRSLLQRRFNRLTLIATDIIIDDNATQPAALKNRISELNQHKRKRLDEEIGDNAGMFSIALRSFCGLTVVDKAITNEDSNAKGSPVRPYKTQKRVSVQTYFESENLWMNKTSQAIEKVIKDCGGIKSLVPTC
jgi:hypothetical protein